MIALTARRRKGVVNTRETARNRPIPTETSIHGIVSGILLLPYFRQPSAPLGCDKVILRWPGPFGSGFLSPQPPGAVGIGPIRRRELIPTLGQRELVLFRLWAAFVCRRLQRCQPPSGPR